MAINLEEMSKAWQEMEEREHQAADAFWDSLSYEDKCNAFHAVVSRIVQGELVEQGSYRYILYDIFKFDLEMYSRGMACGFMDLHNAIDKDVEKFNEESIW